MLECECDMAMLHCLLSRVSIASAVYVPPLSRPTVTNLRMLLQLPNSLPFEELLATAQRLYATHPPPTLERDVQRLEKEECVSSEKRQSLKTYLHQVV